MPLALRRLCLRARIAWCDVRRWGLLQRLAEVRAWEERERADADHIIALAREAEYAETRRRWRAVQPDHLRNRR